MLKLVLSNRIKIGGLESSMSGQEPVAGFCENDHELSDSIKMEEFLDWMSDY
jgi:hypothetical protein